MWRIWRKKKIYTLRGETNMPGHVLPERNHPQFTSEDLYFMYILRSKTALKGWLTWPSQYGKLTAFIWYKSHTLTLSPHPIHNNKSRLCKMASLKGRWTGSNLIGGGTIESNTNRFVDDVIILKFLMQYNCEAQILGMIPGFHFPLLRKNSTYVNFFFRNIEMNYGNMSQSSYN